MDARDGPPVVVMPERLDRRLRLGPFASGRDLVMFLALAAVGAVAGTALSPWLGLAIVVAGAVVTLWRPDGEAIDERVVALARWALRRASGGRAMRRPSPEAGTPGRDATVVLGDGRVAAVLRAGGAPLAYLPPADLARQFERYRELLRGVDGALVLIASRAPIHARSLAPTAPETGDRPAWEGYRDLVALLARRRSVRSVVVAVVATDAGPNGARQLETAVALVAGRLADLGIRAERLVGRPLADTAWRTGLGGTRGAE